MQVQEALFHPTAHSVGYAGATGFLPFVYLAARINVFSRCFSISCENSNLFVAASATIYGHCMYFVARGRLRKNISACVCNFSRNYVLLSVKYHISICKKGIMCEQIYFFYKTFLSFTNRTSITSKNVLFLSAQPEINRKSALNGSVGMEEKQDRPVNSLNKP